MSKVSKYQGQFLRKRHSNIVIIILFLQIVGIMARNAEKAKAMLSRWYRLKRDIRNTTDGKYKEVPRVSECISLQECELERQEVLKVISKLVSDIQNAGLGEHRIRELNDEINKVIREKTAWESRIKELGGPDHKRLSAKIYDTQGIDMPGSGGYKYFGAAKDLPGVRELFFKEAPYEPKKSRTELYKVIDYSYYGGAVPNEILEEERQIEAALREKEFQRFVNENTDLVSSLQSKEETMQFIKERLDQQEDVLRKLEAEKNAMSDSEEFEEDQLEKRKQDLISEYFNVEENRISMEYISQQRDQEGEEMVKQMIKMNYQS